MQTLCDNINLLGSYCGVRDIAALTPASLREKLGVPRADAMVLFGGSILAGGDLLARAMREKVADKYIIVGGEGHTTQTLRDVVHAEIPSLETNGLPEAEIFDRYLQSVHGLKADYLECRSTNCGNNITNLLALVEREHIPFSSVILAQDATMMRRMDAVLRKYRPDIRIVNYATYHAEAVCANGEPVFSNPPRGMWEMTRYISLLMGEIPRLADTPSGYGPKGRNFLVHLDIPPEVQKAFENLKTVYSSLIREANPAYG